MIRWDNDLVWVVYPDGSRCWYTGGLGWFVQSNKKQLKKISFKSRRIKPLLQLYLNIVKHLTLQYLLSKNNQNCFQYIFQPGFTSYFELASSVSFSRFLNIFRLGVINSKNIQACFKDFLNVSMKLGLVTVFETSRSSTISWFLLCKKWYAQTKPCICHCICQTLTETSQFKVMI